MAQTAKLCTASTKRPRRIKTGSFPKMKKIFTFSLLVLFGIALSSGAQQAGTKFVAPVTSLCGYLGIIAVNNVSDTPIDVSIVWTRNSDGLTSSRSYPGLPPSRTWLLNSPNGCNPIHPDGAWSAKVTANGMIVVDGWFLSFDTGNVVPLRFSVIPKQIN